MTEFWHNIPNHINFLDAHSYEWHHFIDVSCESCVSQTLVKKLVSVVCSLSQLSVYRTSCAAHICLGRAGPGSAEGSSGGKNFKHHRKTHFGPQSWSQHSPVKVRGSSPLLCCYVYSKATVTAHVRLHLQLAVQRSHSPGRECECRWRLGCRQGHHQRCSLWTLQETVWRLIMVYRGTQSTSCNNVNNNIKMSRMAVIRPHTWSIVY